MTYPAPDVVPYDEWFDSNSKYDPDLGEYLPENGEEPPRPEEEVVDIHQKMYEIATSKYNPFSVGGSESIHDFD